MRKSIIPVAANAKIHNKVFRQILLRKQVVSSSFFIKNESDSCKSNSVRVLGHDDGINKRHFNLAKSQSRIDIFEQPETECGNTQKAEL